MKTSSFSVLVLCWLILLMPVACQSDNYIDEIPPEAGAGISTEEYLFQVGDRFEVRFLNNTQFNTELEVRPDGRISMNLANDLLVAGMAPAELTELLTEFYKEEIKDPRISINLTRFASSQIWVAGEVNSPGPMPYSGRMTVLQSIAGAGGWMPTAHLDSVVVVRHDEIARETLLYTMDIEDKLDGDLLADFVLRPNDVVYVPRSFIGAVGDWVNLWLNRPVPRWVRLGFGYRIESFDFD